MAIESLTVDYKPIYETNIGKTVKTLEVVVCLRCGRPLTNEKSRLAHLGPKCARKLAYETRTRSFSAKTLQCHKTVLKSSTQEATIPTQNISLYYNPSSSNKPYCKLGTVLLPATNDCTTTDHDYRKKSYSLPLLEGVIYEMCVCLPQVRVFLLQVQEQQLRDSH